MTWITKAQLRQTIRDLRDSHDRAYDVLTETTGSSSGTLFQLAQSAADRLDRQRDSIAASDAELRAVLDALTIPGEPIYLGNRIGTFSVGGVEVGQGLVYCETEGKSQVKSRNVHQAERVIAEVMSLRDKIKAQDEELATFRRQRDQDAVDAEYAALPVCPGDGWLRCPKCAREVNSAVLSDKVGAKANPYSNNNLTLLTHVTYAPGGMVTGPDAPKLPQHLVWQCACGHKLRTKTREES